MASDSHTPSGAQQPPAEYEHLTRFPLRLFAVSTANPMRVLELTSSASSSSSSSSAASQLMGYSAATAEALAFTDTNSRSALSCRCSVANNDVIQVH